MRASNEARDRISRVSIEGFRSLADVNLDLKGLTVLIGDNGSGKSSIVEALETLRYFGESSANLQQYFEYHPSPVRSGHHHFRIGIDLESSDPERHPGLHYEFSIQHKDGSVAVIGEDLVVRQSGDAAQPQQVVYRDLSKGVIIEAGKEVPVDTNSTQLLLGAIARSPRRRAESTPEQRAVQRVADALSTIEVHVPFEVVPAWVARQYRRDSASRESSKLLPATRLEPLATNLANVFIQLRSESEAHWRDTMDYVRLGLGDDIDSVMVQADAAGGHHALAIRFKSIGTPVPASGLSDGTLAYLAFVALLRLPSQRSMLVFDEPELHLHPGLLVRVLSMLESIARTCPVVIATHSDRLLDALLEPAKSAVLCDLDETRATRLVRPDAEMLSKWLKDFRGLGDIRSSGMQAAVMPMREPQQ